MKQDELHKLAVDARLRAHAPYSGYQIGAALKLSNGVVTSGGNIENASYGATVCAERVAIWKAMSENPGARLNEIVVVSDAASPWPPCGLCRQVIAEFADANALIHVGDLQKIHKTYKFSEIFPEAFTPAHLRK